MGRRPVGKRAMSGAERQRRYLTRLFAGKSNAELAYLKKQFAQLALAKRQAAAQWQAEKAALKAEIAALKRVKPRKSTPSRTGTDTELERKNTAHQAGNDRPFRRRGRVRPITRK